LNFLALEPEGLSLANPIGEVSEHGYLTARRRQGWPAMRAKNASEGNRSQCHAGIAMQLLDLISSLVQERYRAKNPVARRRNDRGISQLGAMSAP